MLRVVDIERRAARRELFATFELLWVEATEMPAAPTGEPVQRHES